MNKHDLFKAVGNISDQLIAEAEGTRLRRLSLPKAGLIAAAAALVLGVTAFAATMAVSRQSSHTSNIPDYYSVPSAKTLAEDIGIAPTVVEEFSNGYAFKSGHTVQNIDYAEDDSVIGSHSSLSCKYELDGEDINLFIDRAAAKNEADISKIADTYKGVEIRYISYMNKLVPGDYELTEQDKADRDAGIYVFSFGSPEIEIIEVKGLDWNYNGLSYGFVTIDNDISKDELVQMAKEVIDAQG